MSATEVKNAQLSCPVCYQLFKNPKYLPCYHSYCEGCLEKMQLRSMIICPECRKVARLPEGGVKEFATNFLLNRLVDDLILTRGVSGNEKVKCDICSSEPVISYCHECNIFQCCSCNELHRHNKKYCGHNVLLLTEPSSNKENAPAIETEVSIPLCKEHESGLEHFCETCDELVCMHCTMNKHFGHNHGTAQNMDSKYCSQLKEVTTPIEGMIQDLSDAHNNIDKMMKDIKEQGDEVNKQIEEHYDELIQKLMKQKDQMKEKVHETISQKVEALTTQLKKVDSLQAELASMKESKAVVEKNSDQNVLCAKKQLIADMQRLTEKYKKLSKCPVQSDVMEFIPTEGSFPQFGNFFVCAEYDYLEEDGLSKLTNLEEAPTITNEEDSCKPIDQTVKSFTSTVTAGEARDKDNVWYVASRIVEPDGGTTLNSQKTVEDPNIASCRNYRTVNLSIKIINNNGRMGQPWGVAYGRYGIWAVADRTNHCVHVFDGQDQLVLKFGKSGDKDGQFGAYSPRGIAFDNDNYLYVADSGNNRVQKFDVNGNYLLQFGSRGSGKGQIKCPYGIETHINGRVYVADKGNHRISVFQCDGQFCTSFGSDQLGGPYDIAFNGNNQLLVADHSHKCIVTYTLDGQYVGKFDTQGSYSCQINSPCSLATDANGFILVTNFNHCITVYDHTGNLIHCFGSRGSSSGEFNDPYGIAVSSNGSIYVSDFNNKRVQIFAS